MLKTATSFLALGCLVLVSASAGEKTTSKYTDKPIELKLKDGKVVHDAEFTAKDPKAGPFHYKVFTLELEKGKVYRIDHRGIGGDDTFDPFLVLEAADGKQLEFDDDGGGGLNSRILYKASTTATYRIVTTTYQPNQTGKFALEINPGTANEVLVMEWKDKAKTFGTSTPAQRKQMIADVKKYLVDKDGDLTAGDAAIAGMLGNAAEDEEVELARDLYKEAIRQFAAARDADLSSKLTPPFERAFAALEKVGQPIEITGKLTTGKDFDLRSMKGKVVLVDFWATWCGPCIAELPNMEKAYQKYHKKGFDIIGISLDRPGDEEKLTKFMQGRKMPWPCINIEDSRKLAELHKVAAIPYPVLIDREGRIVSVRARGPALDRLLARLLEEKK